LINIVSSGDLSHNTGLRTVHFEHEAYKESPSWTDRILEYLLQIRSFHLEEVVIRVIEASTTNVTCWETLNLHELDEVLDWPQFSRLRKIQFFIPKYEFASGADEIVREQMAICEARGILRVAPEVWDAHKHVRAFWRT
jgi:hypothetical protein